MAGLTAAQYAIRFENAKIELFRERPAMAQYLKPGSKMYESTIRARVVRELDGEPMDLILLPEWLSTLCRGNSPAQNLPI